MAMSALRPVTVERLQALKGRVLAQVGSTDPRTNELMTSLIKHAHAFVRETQADAGGVVGRASIFSSASARLPTSAETN